MRNILTLGLVLAFLASTVPTATATPCSPGNCRIDQPEISPLDLRICTYGAMLLAHSGGNGQPHLDNQGLNLGGEGYCCITEFFKINPNNNPVYTQGEMDARMELDQVSDREILVSFHLDKYGEDMFLNTTYTLVKNGILVRYDAYNNGGSPWSLGWKYAFDLHLGSYMTIRAPFVKVDNRPGDGKGLYGNDGVYGGQDYDFADPTTRDVDYVEQWKTRTGPNTPDHLYSSFWFDADLGGDPADLLQYVDNMNGWRQVNQWPYELREGTTDDSMLQWTYGTPKLINVKPGEHVERIMWLATEKPDALLTYGVESNFEHQPESRTSQVQFIDAGETATYPIMLQSTTGVDGNTAVAAGQDQVILIQPEEMDIPAGWTSQMFDANTGREVTQLIMEPGETRSLELRVTAPDDAFGEDLARVNFNAILKRPADGTLYNKKLSVFDTALFTTTIIRPNYGIVLEGPADVPVVFPGESIGFGEGAIPPLKVKNIGNLREPLRITMDIASGAGLTWEKDITPSDFTLKRGEEKEVKVRFGIPADEFGGERTIVARATIEDRNQDNTTQLKLRIISNAMVEIVVPDQLGVKGGQIILPPGASRKFDATITNVGFEPVDIDLFAQSDNTIAVVDGQQAVPSDWTMEVFADALKGTLLQGQAVKASIEVTAPTGAPAGSQQNVLIFATKKGQTAKLDEELVRAVVGRVSNFAIDGLVTAASGDPGRHLDYSFVVKNVGNAAENATVEMGKLPAGWVATIDPKEFPLSTQETRQVLVSLVSPPDQYFGGYEPEVIVRNSDLIAESPLVLNARINQIFNVVASTQTPTVRMLPEDVAVIDFEVVNLGNGPDQFFLDGFDKAWTLVIDHDYQGKDDTSVEKTTRVLDAKETARIRLTGSVRGALGTYEMPITAVSVTLGEVPALSEGLPLTLIVSRPDLYVKSVSLGSSARFVGDVETVVAEIENLGGIEAKDIRVELYANDKPTGTFVTFERLAPERTLIASLPWTKTDVQNLAYRVVVDPDQEVDEGDNEDNNEALFKTVANVGGGKVRWLGGDGKVAQNVPAPPFELLLVALMGVYVAVRKVRKA